MDKDICKFEYLPNEIVIEIFKNLDARYLFRAFYNLNSRFNTLLQSSDDCLTVFTPDADESVDDKIFFPYIHTLIIKNGIDIMFDNLINVRRIILHYDPKYSMKDLKVNIAPNLKHFSVLSTHLWSFMFSPNFIENIFSNGFPYLTSCCLSHKSVILSNDKWTQSPSLRIIKIGCIGSNIYKSILSSCPNLYSLKFTKWPMDESTFHIEPHINLKQMVINLDGNDFLNYHRLDSHLSSVPKLEQLAIHVFLSDSPSVKSLKDCDWFVSIIDRYLSMLRQFDCYLNFTPPTYINETDHGNIMDQSRDKFEQIHKDRYKSKIEFDFQ